MNTVEARCYEICCRYIVDDDTSVVIPEPYYPYVPSNWNGILVLAEAQNLANPNDEYVLQLSAASKEDRIRRLYLHDWGIPIQPWHDGSLQLGLAALFEEHEPGTFGVSNAVPWSMCAAPGRNANPDVTFQKRSSDFLEEIFGVLKPELVVTAGRVAQDVVHPIPGIQTIHCRLPSPNAMSRVSGMFDQGDLLKRYPEVSAALEKLPWIAGMGHLRNKVFFACHMVSSGRGQLRQLRVAAGPVEI